MVEKNSREKIRVEKDCDGMRLDKFISQKREDLSRSLVQKFIKKGHILVNEEKTKKSYQLNKGDEITVYQPPPRTAEPEPVTMDLNILYEDKSILILNKQAGLVVHPAPGHRGDTLVNGLLAYSEDLAGINNVLRPGIVHRLDKDTSGVMVVAKNDMAMKSLVRQFKKREVEKIYHTIVKGQLSYQKGKIDAPIGRDPHDRKKMAVRKNNSKKAVSFFEVIERFDDFTYLKIKLITGRTHQIRVHFSYLNHPVVGDEKYGKSKASEDINRQLLHAYQLTLTHPETKRRQTFTAKLPDDFKIFLEKLQKKNKKK